MADIFVSYTSSDKEWAFWIGQELEKLGHTARVHKWEIAAGGDINMWMEERRHYADHILLVISEAYLKAPFSSQDRSEALTIARTKGPGFVLPVLIEPCEVPASLAPLNRFDLYGLTQDEARARLVAFMKPVLRQIEPVPFPGTMRRTSSGSEGAPRPVAFPGKSDSRLKERTGGISNIPIDLPQFVGTDGDFAAIESALSKPPHIAVLHGPLGIGKSTLAAAYAERHRTDFRATWWVGDADSIPADLVELGWHLGWVSPSDEGKTGLLAVRERLNREGEAVLLIYDDAPGPDELRYFLSLRGIARTIVTSTESSWSAIASPIEVGASFRRLLNQNVLLPPDNPLPEASPATRFVFVGGKLDSVPPIAWGERVGQAAVYHARARNLVENLANRLRSTDAVPDLSVSVLALLDILGGDVATVQPDQLRLASRSISAKARAYGHSAAQWEISPESVSAFFELDGVLVDLQSFVRTEIEAHEAAIRRLDLTPTAAAEAKATLDLFTDGILSSTEIVEERVELAFNNAAAISDAAVDQQAKIQIEGDRALLAGNVALAVARELGRDVKELPNDTTDALAATARKHLPHMSHDRKGPGRASESSSKNLRRRRGANQSAAELKELSWESFSGRVLARVNAKGPEAIGDALIEAATSLIKKPRSTIAGLGAAIVLLSTNAPIFATGALATTVAWIAYELRRRDNQPK